jgi:hypothetical protein
MRKPRPLIACSALLLVLGTTGQAEIQRWRVGDQGQPWNLSPVSGRLNWGRGWTVEVVTDDDGDGMVDEDGVEVIDNDGDGLVNEDPVDPQVDNDGDGKLNEDPVDRVDNDGDGLIDEDPAEQFDNDLDGLIDEDGPDPQIDNDGDGKFSEDGRMTNGDDDRDGKFNEDPLDGVDNDGDGLIDEDGPRLADDPANGVSTWLQPIRLDSTRNLATLINERYLDGEFGGVTADKTLLNPFMVLPSEFGYRNEGADPISADNYAVASATGRVDFSRMVDNDLSSSFFGRGDGLGGINIILNGYYYINRITFRPRPTLPNGVLSYYNITYGDPSTISAAAQVIQPWKTLRPDVQAEFVPVVKDFELDPPVLMGRLDVNATEPYGVYVETAEVGIFGEGFPIDASFVSEIIDVGTATPRFRRYAQQMELYAESDSAKLTAQFAERAGKLVNWGKARWKGRRLGEGQEGEVRIQFRAGNSLDTHVYARRLGPGLSDDRDDQGKPLTAFKWAKLTDGRIEELSLQYNELGQRLGADDLRGWSFWSAPFSFEEGLIDTTLPQEQWTAGGVPLPLPGGTRYIQFRLLFDSAQQSAVSLDYLEFDYDVPLASGGVLAEIFPAQVPLGQDQSFHYYLRPLFSESDGGSFNRIEIEVPDADTRIEALRFDGQDWQALPAGTGADPLAQVQPKRLAPAAGRADSLGQFAQSIAIDPATSAARLMIKLPPMSARHFRLGESLEIVFTSKLFRGSKQFTSSVWNDQSGVLGAIIPQPAEGGDATPEVATDDVNVVVEQIDKPLSAVRLSANPFTPNGDGANDQLEISFDLFLLLEQVQVQVDIFDLSGRQVATVGPLPHTAGTARITWDGKNGSGDLVPPGLYLYRLKVGGSASATEQAGTLSVVY